MSAAKQNWLRSEQHRAERDYDLGMSPAQKRAIDKALGSKPMNKIWRDHNGKIAALLLAAIASFAAWSSGLVERVFGPTDAPPAASQPATPGN